MSAEGNTDYFPAHTVYTHNGCSKTLSIRGPYRPFPLQLGMHVLHGFILKRNHLAVKHSFAAAVTWHGNNFLNLSAEVKDQKDSGLLRFILKGNRGLI